MKPILTQIEEEFKRGGKQRTELRRLLENYANNGSNRSRYEDEIINFLTQSNLRVIEKVKEVVEKSFESHMHYGIHGEPVENPLMHVADLKRFVLEDLSLIEQK